MYCTAITTVSLFEVVWEEASLDYPDIFGLDEIQGRVQMIREHTNRRIDKLVLATVGFGRPRRSIAVDSQGDAAQCGETKKKSKSKTKAESRRDEIKYLRVMRLLIVGLLESIVRVYETGGRLF
jgi:hypothetical protein